MAVNDRPKILWRSQNRAVISGIITADGADTETTALSVGTTSTYNRAAGSFLDDGFAIDDSVTASGFTNAGNNVTSTVTAVTATVLTVDATLVVEGAGSDERIVAGVTPDTPLAEMKDPRRLLWTKFPTKTINLNIDLGPRSPWNISLAGVLLQKASVATVVTIQSKATVAATYTTQETVQVWTQETTDGADGFGADERPADEYPDDDTREFPDSPLMYVLLATAVNHRWWRIRITDTGGDSNIYVSLPFLGIPWEAPSNKGLTTFTLTPSDASEVTESPAGVDTTNPGRKRKELQISFQDADATDTWQSVLYRIEEHGTSDPVLALLIPPSSAANVKTATDADGRLLYRSTVYGRISSLPGFSIPANQGLSLVNIGGLTIRESF